MSYNIKNYFSAKMTLIGLFISITSIFVVPAGYIYYKNAKISMRMSDLVEYGYNHTKFMQLVHIAGVFFVFGLLVIITGIIFRNFKLWLGKVLMLLTKERLIKICLFLICVYVLLLVLNNLGIDTEIFW